MQTLKLTKKYETYPEYKDSGIEWLGAIPKSWSVEKLKSRTTFLNGYSFDSDTYTEDGLPIIRITDVGQEVDFSQVKRVPYELRSKIKRFGIKKNDILIALTGATIGKTSIYDREDESYLNQRVGIIRPAKNKKLGLDFLKFQIESNVFKKNIEVSCIGGAQDNIGKNEIGNMFFAFPEQLDQDRISKYLSNQTTLLDESIEKKKKLTLLLKERRTALINNVIVTANGELGKLKNYIHLNPSKKGISATGPEDMVSFVPMEAISELGELQLQERKYKDVSSGFTYFRNGDVVLAKITPCYENGKAGVMKGLKNDFGFGTTEFMVLRPSNKILADYLYYIVFSDKFRKMGEVEMRGTAGQKRVTSSFVMNYELSIPDVKTQEKIVAELNKKMKMFDVAIAKVETSISYLKEFKTSLISNVVTGKIKV
jgi:type I restriction enzyme, S subunit